MSHVSREERASLLGFGVVAPLRRLEGDFEGRGGAEAVRAALGQILGTRPGELPWRPSFGLDLDDLRNQAMTEELRELARARVQDALSLWDARIQVLDLSAVSDGANLRVSVAWRVALPSPAGAQTLVEPTVTEVQI